MAWSCPYAKILKGEICLSCTKAMKPNVDYNLKENKMNVFCACQRWCPDCGRVINSEGAKRCYEYHSRE